MKIKLTQFQESAVERLRYNCDQAIDDYRKAHTPQVVSLQAPTGSGKTIMMTALIENILFGDEIHEEKTNAVFVWLSDSPNLNQQSKDKIDSQSSRIRFGQTEIVTDESFDRETFDDGKIYFINTGKLSKAGNLGKKSDKRNYTVWQTIRNTVEQKSDRLYFIIDEAHRGMQGQDGGRQTAIMQKFLRGWPDLEMPAMPLVIGMSATPERFNKLVESLPSTTIRPVFVPTEEVRASGLLKDRIIVKYPDDVSKQDPYAVLTAATKEWLDKCEHWKTYCSDQHYRNVNPVFVVQVEAGTKDNPVSRTDLNAALAKITDVVGNSFKPGEVVHTFGSASDLTVNGLNIPHVEACDIDSDRNIRVVFFKESLSTGWDCPRAETMMSFCRHDDATYIAQLLGRMIRTPLQQHVNVDDTLNEVKLYLPYYDKETVEDIISVLKSTECGDIPAYIGGESLIENGFEPWSTKKPIRKAVDPNQMTLPLVLPELKTARTPTQIEIHEIKNGADEYSAKTQDVPVAKTSPVIVSPVTRALENEETKRLLNPEAEKTEAPVCKQQELHLEIDRADIIARINQMGITKYLIRTRAQHVNDYLAALLKLSGFLARTRICPNAGHEVREDITGMMHDAIIQIQNSGQYKKLEKAIREIHLGTLVFDPFGNTVSTYAQSEFAFTSDLDIDRQFMEAEKTLCRGGLTLEYGKRYAGDDDQYKIDCIIFSKDEVCMEKVYVYAKKKFHELDDEYRKYVVGLQSESDRNEYSEIVASSSVVSEHSFTLPLEIPSFGDPSGKEYDNHLYVDGKNGVAKIAFDSSWESDLLEEEAEDFDFVCWLRNRANAKWALCIPYEKDGEKHGFFPDILIVRRDHNPNSPFGYIIDMLEPHSGAFADNLAKAKGLAAYAARNLQFGRIQLIRKEAGLGGGSVFRRLDFCKGEIRERVLKAVNAEELDHIFSTDGIVLT